MSNYDLRVSDAKAAATRAVANLAKNDRQGKPLCDGDAMQWVATAVDDLNKAWDALTDALVRQRDECGEQVVRLIHELAEAKKGK